MPAATPDKSNIPLRDGQPDVVELVEGPPCECGKCPPHTVFGFAFKVDPEHVQRLAEKVQAMAVLADAEVPEDFNEYLEHMAEEANSGGAQVIIDGYDACWN